MGYMAACFSKATSLSICFVAMAAFCGNALSSDGKKYEQKMMEIFDFSCVNNPHGKTGVENIAKAMGGKELSIEDLQNDPVLKSLDGRAFVVPYENDKFIVASSAPKGGCSVLAKKFNPAKVKEVITKNFPVQPIHTESTGARTVEFFSIKNESMHRGGTVVISYGKQETEIDFGTIGFVSKEAQDAAGVRRGGGPRNASDTTPYVNKAKRFSVAINEQWEKIPASDASTDLSAQCKPEICGQNVVISFGAVFHRGLQSLSRADFLRSANGASVTKEVKSSPMVARLSLVREGVVKVGGLDGYEVLSELTIKNGVKHMRYTLITFNEGYVYGVNLGFPPDLYDKAMAAAKPVLASFRVH